MRRHYRMPTPAACRVDSTISRHRSVKSHNHFAENYLRAVQPGKLQLMTSLGKCLVVVAIVISLAFLGVVGMSWIAGPNFEAELGDPAFSDFHFTKAVDDEGKATWSAETRLQRYRDPSKRTGKFEIQKVQGANAKVLPSVMMQALKDEKTWQTARKTNLKSQLDALKKKIAAAIAANAADRQAAIKRLEGIDKRIQQLAQTRLNLSTAMRKNLTEVEVARGTIKVREEEIERLTSQIDILKADKERLETQLRKLQVALKELQAEVVRLEDRNGDLKKQLNPPAEKTNTTSVIQ